MVLSVADVDEVLVLSKDVTETLGVMKSSFSVASIDQSDLSCTNDFKAFECSCRNYDNSVVTRV